MNTKCKSREMEQQVYIGLHYANGKLNSNTYI